LVIQCAKDSAASVEGLQMMRKLGTYVEVGIPFGFGNKISIDLPKLGFSKGTRAMSLVTNNPFAFDKAFRLLRGVSNIRSRRSLPIDLKD